MLQHKSAILMPDWKQWERLAGVIFKAGASLSRKPVSLRSEQEITALEAVHQFLDVHYNLMVEVNTHGGYVGRNSLSLLTKQQKKIAPSHITRLIRSFQSVQQALAPVFPLIAREIACAFQVDQAACAFLVGSSSASSRPTKQRSAIPTP